MTMKIAFWRLENVMSAIIGDMRILVIKMETIKKMISKIQLISKSNEKITKYT